MKDRLNHLIAVVSADRRKAAILLALLVFLGGIAIRSVLNVGPHATEAADSESSIEDPTELGGSAITRTLAALERVRGEKYTVVRVAPHLSRNIFDVDDAYFPPPAQVVIKSTTDYVTPPPQIEPVKPTADEQWALTVAQIRVEARRLTLRSVIVGKHPLAVIEEPGGGRSVLEPGKIIRGFRLVEVKSDAVLLDKEGVRVRLWLTVTGL